LLNQNICKFPAIQQNIVGSFDPKPAGKQRTQRNGDRRRDGPWRRPPVAVCTPLQPWYTPLFGRPLWTLNCEALMSEALKCLIRPADNISVRTPRV